MEESTFLKMIGFLNERAIRGEAALIVVREWLSALNSKNEDEVLGHFKFVDEVLKEIDFLKREGIELTEKEINSLRKKLN